ncbi:MAG: Asp-tRNA(Asn)/Glu-tRNA(Gln) amidotransferase subunit GatA [Candidatus Yanofskybacteria bacterium]|nr:Asp-tRNA(Asn)/Glu-tRNA(Gln) amidotransferase subunit GatA [Candidatus Yanofskybacteria bacterium]
MNISDYTIKSINEGLKRGEFSVEEITAEYQKLAKKENPKFNAYLSIFDPLPDSKFRTLVSPLTGIPCAVKDNILIEGEKCTAASRILENYIAPYDATVITKLKNAGAVFLGKTNLDEFAMGATGEKSAFGPTLNPHDNMRVAGGSSSGSGAAVAAGLAVYALGSDTGGSIRAPAAWCGVVGLKPTYGLVSRHGLIAMASSLDQIGPITKTVEDVAIVLNTIAGHDQADSTSISVVSSMPNSSYRELPDYTANLKKPIAGLKVAVPKEFFTEGLDSQVNNLVQAAIAKLELLGAHVDQVSLPMIDYAIATYYIIVSSEVSANLARYDGMRYGLSSKKAENLLDTYLETRANGLGDEVKRRIMLGTYALSAGYYDAYYLKAQKVRALIKKDFDRIFEKYDVVVGPTMPTVAPKLNELDNPLSAYLADIYTSPINLAGLPAVSLPCGFAEVVNKKLPVGFQIVAKHFDEARLLQVAFQLEESLK